MHDLSNCSYSLQGTTNDNHLQPKVHHENIDIDSILANTKTVKYYYLQWQTMVCHQMKHDSKI